MRIIFTKYNFFVTILKYFAKQFRKKIGIVEKKVVPGTAKSKSGSRGFESGCWTERELADGRGRKARVGGGSATGSTSRKTVYAGTGWAEGPGGDGGDCLSSRPVLGSGRAPGRMLVFCAVRLFDHRPVSYPMEFFGRPEPERFLAGPGAAVAARPVCNADGDYSLDFFI